MVVPVLIVVALALVVLQKPLTTALRSRSGEARRARSRGRRGRDRGSDRCGRVGGRFRAQPAALPALVGSIGAASVYGGYFTAAQGVLYLGILGVFTGRSMGAISNVGTTGSDVNLAAAPVCDRTSSLADLAAWWLDASAAM